MLFEQEYIKLINKIINKGQRRQTRNEETVSIFGEVIQFDDLLDHRLPVLIGRKYPIRGVIGEFAGYIKGPKNIKDFKDFGCNYWDKWGDSDGNLNVSYGNLWTDWNGTNQIQEVIDSIKTNPAGRRHIVSGWDPSVVKDLSLPCCHYSYQWYVNGDRLEMIWNQRSVDTMLGLPADAILASLWNILLAKETGYRPGKITMMLGDTHIYTPHFTGVVDYINQAKDIDYESNYYTYSLKDDVKLLSFKPEDISIDRYGKFNPNKISMELFE